VAHADGQAGLGGERGQLGLPGAAPVSVGATTVGGDQQPVGVRVVDAAAGVPPGPHRVHRERGGLVVDAHRHPSGVGAQVVDAVGDRLARLADEVVDLDLLRVAGGSVVAAGVLVLADEFLFLAVDADHRHPGGQGGGDGVVDVAELGIAIRVAAALQGLGVGLQAVAGLVQQPPHQRRGHPMPLATELIGHAPQ